MAPGQTQLALIPKWAYSDGNRPGKLKQTAFGGESESRGPADSASGTCDDNALIFEFAHVISFQYDYALWFVYKSGLD